jgi:hypothetical protein
MVSALTPPAALPDRLGRVFRLFAAQGSPRILVAALAVAVGARLALGAWSAWDLVVVAAIGALWPLQEWGIHVFILHAEPGRGIARLDPRTPRLHRAHHLDPWQPDLIFIPRHTFLFTLPLLVGIYGLLLPTWALALTGIATHLALALHYEWVHLLVHTRYRPRTALYRRLWRNHRLHHFKNEKLWFGVTMLGGDRLLRTGPDPGAVATSPTCRTLGREDDLGAASA